MLFPHLFLCLRQVLRTRASRLRKRPMDWFLLHARVRFLMAQVGEGWL
jgi:hypothetical protein